MIDKLKELLGEELAAQVTEKLGDVEIGITNDGSWVPADKFETLKADHKNLKSEYKTSLDDLNSKLTEAVKSSEDSEKLKSLVEEMKTEHQKSVDTYESKLNNITINSAVEVALVKANAKNNKAISALLDYDQIKIEDGQVKGIDGQIKTLMESDSYLFHETKKQGKEPAKGVLPVSSDKRKLIEAYEKASPSDKLLIAEQIKKLEE